MSYFLGLSTNQWAEVVISLLIIVITVILGRWVVNLILARGFGRLAQKTKTSLDDTLIKILKAPLYMLLIVLAFDISFQRLDFIAAFKSKGLNDFFYVLYFIVGLIFAWRFVVAFFDWYGREIAVRTETDLDEQLFPFFRRIALIILGSIALITLLGYFDVDVSAMVATLGIGCVSVTFGIC